jgi:tRNA modification GTPase
MRDGLVLVVQGAPNAGKSTLVNALAGRDVAIVSAMAGTTRDTLEIPLVLGDAPVTLIDTAGLRDTADPVEAEGVRRARAKAAQADLVLMLISVEIADAKAALTDMRSRETSSETFVPSRLVLATKCDLGPHPPEADLAISVVTGAGMAALHDRLAAFARDATGQSGPPPLTRQRHRAHLSRAAQFLHDAMSETEPELRAEAMRLALSELGRITGTIGVEALLDRIFADFCIGK